MAIPLIHYFTDSVLHAPTIGCMLMCLTAALVGTFVVLRKKSLIGETLSHACYPGVIIALFIERLFFSAENHELVQMLIVLGGAAFSSFLGMYTIHILEKRYHVSTDAALSATLSIFFGIGLLLLSGLQQEYPSLYKDLQSYLFGQVATMRDIHVMVYAILASFVLLLIFLYFREIQAVIFDSTFADIVGISLKKIETLLFVMVVLAVVIGIRSCGVVLISAMLIFPAAAARQCSHNLIAVLGIAAIFGLIAGFFGVVLSHEVSTYFGETGPGMSSSISSFSFPTGPMIVVVAACIFCIVIFFSGRTGLVLRLYRKGTFLWNCEQENLLKTMWKVCSQKNNPSISIQEIDEVWQGSRYTLHILLFTLRKRGWIRKKVSTGTDKYILTPYGMLWGRKIVRLHRLWELYLVTYCKMAKDRVHPSAEQMEHSITPEIEKELTYILHNPKNDPHAQPIPEGLDNDLYKSLLR
ncbi:MAG: putative metal transport system rane protein [Chlamydiia bacterium]|nr:putative metal transport system rane protein [Chlamydiia bacterium]